MMIYVLIFLGGSLLYSQCDDYNQPQCSNDDNCEWVENIESVTCASLTWDEELCEASPDCNYSCDDGGGYFGWCDPYCGGGMTYIDNGYCQEVEYQLGDLNQDSNINIQDIIQIVDLILYQQYNNIADMNNDQVINVIDVIQIIDIILNGEI